MADSVNYQVMLRAAQAAFRERDVEKAQEIAKKILIEKVNCQETASFLSAVNKYIFSMMNRSLRSKDYGGAMRFSRAILSEADYSMQAQSAFIGAARAALSATEQADILSSLSYLLKSSNDYWNAMADLLSGLPATTKNIDMGFEILERFPGHAMALAGLHDLIDRYRQCAPA
jgi:hypothetical protein